MDKPSASMPDAPVFAAHIDPASSIIYSNMEDVVFHLVVEGDGRYRFLLVNPAFQKATGLPPDQVVGKLVDEVIPEPSRSKVLAQYRDAIRSHATRRWEEVTDYPAGRKVGAVSVTPVFDGFGRCTDLIGTVHDITELKRREQQLSDANAELQRSHELLTKLAQQVPGALFELVMQPNGQLHCRYISAMAQELFALSPDQIRADCTQMLAHATPRDRARVRRALRHSADTLTPWRIEFPIELPGQGVRWREFNAKPTRDADGSTVWHGFIHDISERKQNERTIREFNEALERRANYDSLTGLPNRMLFRDRLEQAIEHARGGASAMAVLFIDLDRFKQVNDLLGHAVGDALLVQAARRIEQCVAPGDTVARLGGDEFIVILTESAELAHIERTAQRIIDKLARPFKLDEESAFVSASVGIALYPDDATQPEALMRSADQAMYRAKASGRNQLSFFEPAMQEAAMRRMVLGVALRQAVPRHELELHFQPVMDLAGGRIAKAEALLRWRRPGFPLAMPGEFIDIAEETGLIHAIGNWVFTEAVNWAKRWSGMLGRPFQISINKSPIQFQGSVHTMNWIDHLRSLDMPANSISVEITEGVLLNLSGDVLDKLHELHSGGIEVSIDDFGTGYSSMSYLKRLEIDYLKIDRSFIAGMLREPTSRTITETIIVMAHKLGLKVIAEGVETDAQRDWLRRKKCDYAQGFLFAQPMPAQEFERLLLGQPPASG
ncbi:EAL domain-containing protein [Massilia sp. R2A-15]|uniref:sensor domain-containing protein n=1 Tax=Massilia sp. R2A-15 TaxID=3064278 RepID=UPI0027330086|nr:EAL domain-containing protein [Massilia sp. R2A-15]WLI91381.1 EAL domain-containing protein [Massilia sp. R2A-15]